MVRFDVANKCGGKWWRNMGGSELVVNKVVRWVMGGGGRCGKDDLWWEKCGMIYTRNLFNYILGGGGFAVFAHRTTTITNFKEYTLSKGGI